MGASLWWFFWCLAFLTCPFPSFSLLNQQAYGLVCCLIKEAACLFYFLTTKIAIVFNSTLSLEHPHTLFFKQSFESCVSYRLSLSLHKVFEPLICTLGRVLDSGLLSLPLPMWNVFLISKQGQGRYGPQYFQAVACRIEPTSDECGVDVGRLLSEGIKPFQFGIEEDEKCRQPAPSSYILYHSIEHWEERQRVCLLGYSLWTEAPSAWAGEERGSGSCLKCHRLVLFLSSFSKFCLSKWFFLWCMDLGQFPETLFVVFIGYASLSGEWVCKALHATLAELKLSQYSKFSRILFIDLSYYS